MTSHDESGKEPKLAPRRRRKRAEVGTPDLPGAEGVGTHADSGVAKSLEIDGFYRAFEERFRGPRSLVKTRLRAYLPFVLPLMGLHEPVSAIDLGCGRGEWLELLREHGINARGVDLDRSMLQACHELDLPAVEGDAIDHLRGLGDGSQSIVSGFHIAEHLPFDSLKILVAEALRVLKPGGLLILETPNPENVVVGTKNFYMDPTHLQPIPPELLAFLIEHQGFSRCKVVRLHEAPDLLSRPEISLMDVFNGVSPDYAVVAQTAASDDALSLFSPAFEQSYGVEFDALVQTYSGSVRRWVEESVRLSERRISERLLAVESQADALRSEARDRAEVAEAQIASLRDQVHLATAQAAAEHALREHLHSQLKEAEVRALEAKIRIMEVEAKAQQAEAQTNQALAELGAIHASTSWRITSLLRWTKAKVTRVPGLSKVRAVSNDPVGHVIRYVVRRPRLERITVRLIGPFPGIVSGLRDNRTAQSRADFVVPKSAGSNPHQTVTHVSAMNSQAMGSPAFLNSAASRDLTVDEILRRIRAELAEAQIENSDDVEPI